MYSTPPAQLSPFPSCTQTVVLSPIVIFSLPVTGSTQPPQPTMVGVMEAEGASVTGDAVGSCAWTVSRDTANTSTPNSNTRLTADEQTLLAGRLLEDAMVAKDICNKVSWRLGDTVESNSTHESSQVSSRRCGLLMVIVAVSSFTWSFALGGDSDFWHLVRGLFDSLECLLF
jgi:hypothetical protein